METMACHLERHYYFDEINSEMKNLFIILVVFPLLNSCDVRNSEEFKELLEENEKLKLQIDSLSNTSENRFLNANKLFTEEKWEDAINAFENYVRDFSDSFYTSKAIVNLDKAKRELRNLQAENERRERLKFRAINATNPVKIDSISIRAFGFNFTNEFTFDRYDDNYHYRQAERGSKFLSFDVSIMSESKHPNLPLFYVYVFDSDRLIRISGLKGMTYEFHRWDDYGSYLGNYADYGNDFSRTRTIRFDLGEQLVEDKYKGKEIYIVMSKKEYAYRKSTRIGNPEIQYSPYSVETDIPEILDLDEFEKNFLLVQRL